MDRATVKDIVRQIDSLATEHSKGWNFRCVVCGDSKKNRGKKRGWVLYDGVEQSATYYCFNCGHSQGLITFLKERYKNLYSRYVKTRTVKEILSSKSNVRMVSKALPEVQTSETAFMEASFGLWDRQSEPKIMRLQLEALKFVRLRQIPDVYSRTFRVAYNGKYKNRLLIPYLDNSARVYAFQGRDLFNTSAVKYLTNKNENGTKVFNFYTADVDADVPILEGPFDAMFLVNAIATTGLVRYETEQFVEIVNKFSKRIWVFDNDKPGLEQALEFAEHGERVFCWPKKYKVKDINELKIVHSLTDVELNDIVLKNTKKGMDAVIQLKIK